MKSRFPALSLLAASCLCGCATTPQGELAGAGVGAALGGAAGVALGGGAAGALQGAIVGAVAGAAVTGLVKGPIIKQRQYYRDTQGFCYWVDKKGTAQYDKSVKC